MTANIPAPAPLQRLTHDLVVYVRKPGAIRILPLKTPATGVPPIAVGAIFAPAIFHDILAVTVGTLDLNRLVHRITLFYEKSFRIHWTPCVICRCQPCIFFLICQYKQQRIYDITYSFRSNNHLSSFWLRQRVHEWHCPHLSSA